MMKYIRRTAIKEEDNALEPTSIPIISGSRTHSRVLPDDVCYDGVRDGGRQIPKTSLTLSGNANRYERHPAHRTTNGAVS